MGVLHGALRDMPVVITFKIPTLCKRAKPYQIHNHNAAIDLVVNRTSENVTGMSGNIAVNVLSIIPSSWILKVENNFLYLWILKVKNNF